MAFEIVAAPVYEPFTTEEAKQHLRVDLADEDVLIDAVIVAARTYAENFLRRKLITQDVKIIQTGFGAGLVPLPFLPVQSIQLIQYKQPTDGVLTTLAASEYQLIKSVEPHHIAPVFGSTWPTVLAEFDNVEITIRVGYGDAPSDIPADIMAAMRLLLGHFFENRQNEVAGTVVNKVTLSAERLLLPHVLHN